MTIFDVIRYPISDVPTKEQLQALPPRLFRRWASKVNFDRKVSIHGVVFWYEAELENRKSWKTDALSRGDIPLLREMIRRKR